jgi:hypothetical protein
MADVMSLNTCHVMVYFTDSSNEGLKYIGLNFTGANWVDLFLQGPKSKLENFTGPKTPFTLNFICKCIYIYIYIYLLIYMFKKHHVIK